jgi:hypothetical protein
LVLLPGGTAVAGLVRFTVDGRKRHRAPFPRTGRNGVDTSSRPTPPSAARPPPWHGLSSTRCWMNLIYSHNYAAARDFAHNHELVPGDWKWINDARVVRDYPRADIYKVSHWEANAHRADIDAALNRAGKEHRLGMLTDDSGPH